MSMVVTDGTKLNAGMTATANKIREKTGGSAPIAWDYTNDTGFAAAVDAIQTGGGAVLEALNVSANGDYYPESGVDGYDEVHVTVPSYPEPTGTIQISSNGTVNVQDYASAEVNVPSGITAADEGKVVKNGALVAQTARATAITENGTYDTTENNEVTVNVQGGGGGSSGVYVGTTAPSSSIGNNGDYYYQRDTSTSVLKNFISNSYSTQQIYGYEFTPTRNLTLKNFKFRSVNAGINIKIRIGTTSEIKAESSLIQSRALGFVLTDLADFEVEANVNYIVQAVTENSSGLFISYGSFDVEPNTITRVKNRYSSFPGTQESVTSTNFIAIAFDVDEGLYHVQKEYYKSNGQWSEI